MIVRLFELEFFKEDAGHRVVIVLAGVHENLLDCSLRVLAIVLLDGSQDRADFDKLRPRPDDV
jgi:hypothetical protein